MRRWLVAIALILFLQIQGTSVQAASGTVYSCVVTRCYRHPITGVIEDSGGEQSFEIGQGMVEGAVYPMGLYEVTDTGECYLTIRMSLADFCTGHSFWVQTAGDDGWTSPESGISATGEDANGTTLDVCIQVPGENCVVRGAMYVEPMGRDVYWYMYPGDFTEGNSTDMQAAFVTEPETTKSDEGALEHGNALLTAGAASPSEETDESEPSAAALLQKGVVEEASRNGNQSAAEKKPTLSGLNSTVKEPKSEQSKNESAETLPLTKSEGGGKGLSLSTGKNAEGDEESAQKNPDSNEGASSSSGMLIAFGVLLIAVIATVFYFVGKNRGKLGGSDNSKE
ncbi:MAG: heme-binding Shp domain-containing protein [Ndongobacter sp.]|nr:heme-binding Shp domain-containing protein [Ndongobacter sp.]